MELLSNYGYGVIVIGTTVYRFDRTQSCGRYRNDYTGHYDANHQLADTTEDFGRSPAEFLHNSLSADVRKRVVSEAYTMEQSIK